MAIKHQAANKKFERLVKGALESYAENCHTLSNSQLVEGHQRRDHNFGYS